MELKSTQVVITIFLTGIEGRGCKYERYRVTAELRFLTGFIFIVSRLREAVLRNLTLLFHVIGDDWKKRKCSKSSQVFVSDVCVCVWFTVDIYSMWLLNTSSVTYSRVWITHFTRHAWVFYFHESFSIFFLYNIYYYMLILPHHAHITIWVSTIRLFSCDCLRLVSFHVLISHNWGTCFTYSQFFLQEKFFFTRHHVLFTWCLIRERNHTINIAHYITITP